MQLHPHRIVFLPLHSVSAPSAHLPTPSTLLPVASPTSLQSDRSALATTPQIAGLEAVNVDASLELGSVSGPLGVTTTGTVQHDHLPHSTVPGPYLTTLQL